MKKKNPTDATTRNVRASKKRDDKQALEIYELKQKVKRLMKAVFPFES